MLQTTVIRITYAIISPNAMLRITLRNQFPLNLCSGAQYVIISPLFIASDHSTWLFHPNAMLRIPVRNYFTLIQCSGAQCVIISH